MQLLSFLLLILSFAGCSSINFSQMSLEAKDFHPKTIAVLPATVGEYEPSRDIIDTVVSQSWAKRAGM